MLYNDFINLKNGCPSHTLFYEMYNGEKMQLRWNEEIQQYCDIYQLVNFTETDLQNMYIVDIEAIGYCNLHITVGR